MENNGRFIEHDPNQAADAKKLADRIMNVLDLKKAGNLNLMHISKRTIIADYFVIATGTSSTHIHSLTQEVEFQLKQEGIPPLRIDGANSNDWIILDYGSVIVHVFNSEAREYYKLEKLWEDSGIIDMLSTGEPE